MMDSRSLLECRERLCSSILVERPVLFNRDGRYMFLSSSKEIRVHSVTNGEFIRSLLLKNAIRMLSIDIDRFLWTEDECFDHLLKPYGNSVGVCLHPVEGAQIYVAYDMGLVVLWDYYTGEPVAYHTFDFCITNIASECHFPDHIFIISRNIRSKLANGAGDGDEGTDTVSIDMSFKIIRYNVCDGRTVILEDNTSYISKLDWITMVSDETSKSLVFHTGTEFYLLPVSKNESNVYKSLRYIHNYEITSSAISPVDMMISIGDTRGIVWICYLDTPYFCLKDNNPDPIEDRSEDSNYERLVFKHKTLLHWHCRNVWATKFSDDGNYILSGGEENVVVIWNINGTVRSGHHGLSHNMKFLPRVSTGGDGSSSPGSSGLLIFNINISKDQKYIFVSCGDNTIRVFKMSNHAEHFSIDGLMCSTVGICPSMNELETKDDLLSSLRKDICLILSPHSYWDRIRRLCTIHRYILKKGLDKKTETTYLLDILQYFELTFVYRFSDLQHRMFVKKSPRDGCVVSPNGLGYIQFYNVLDNVLAYKHIKRMEIVPQNVISSVEKHLNTEYSKIYFLEFSKHGKWLATIDWKFLLTNKIRAEKEVIMYIRLWLFNNKKNDYELHTRIDSPHLLEINSLSTGGSSEEEWCILTTSYDKTFKLWKYKNNSKWVCDWIGYYKNYTPIQSSFSEDGSLLAIIFKYEETVDGERLVCLTLTIWSPEQKTLLHAFHPANRESFCEEMVFSFCSFVKNTTFVVVAFGLEIFVYDVLYGILKLFYRVDDSSCRKHNQKQMVLEKVHTVKFATHKSLMALSYSNTLFIWDCMGFYRNKIEPLKIHHMECDLLCIDFLKVENGIITLVTLDFNKQLKLLTFGKDLYHQDDDHYYVGKDTQVNSVTKIDTLELQEGDSPTIEHNDIFINNPSNGWKTCPSHILPKPEVLFRNDIREYVEEIRKCLRSNESHASDHDIVCDDMMYGVGVDAMDSEDSGLDCYSKVKNLVESIYS